MTDKEVVIVGATFSGKSGYLEESEQSIATVGTNFYKKDGLRIWELSGHSAYRRIIEPYIKLAKHAYLIMFNNVNRSTFDEVYEEWIPIINKQNDKLPKYLIENSFGGKPEVSENEINYIIQKYNLKYKKANKECLKEIYNELNSL